MTYSRSELSDCVEREIAMRRRVYPKWIESRRLKQAEADKQIAMMEAIARVLKAISDESISQGQR